MMQSLECPGQANLAAVAGYYAQMTGVLAGFAFTSLVVLMTPTQVDERGRKGIGKENGVLLILLAAFIALLIATLTYSVLAGENIGEAKSRAATGELIDGVPFSLAVVMLFQGVTLLMENGNIDRVAVWTARATTVVLVPTLAYYYLATGTQDTQSARAGNTLVACTSTRLPDHAQTLSIVLPVVLICALIPKLQPKAWRRWARKLRSATPITVLLVSVSAAMASSNVAGRAPGFLLSSTALDAYLTGTFAMFIVLGIMLAFSYSGPDASPTPLGEDRSP